MTDSNDSGYAITDSGQPIVITGWGRSPSSSSTRIDFGDTPERYRSETLARYISTLPPSHRIIARGLGRSYGDASLCAGGRFVSPEDLSHSFDFDPTTRRLRVSAGVSLDEIMRRLIPSGYFVPVTPGTRYVTIGGAIAADIHGKNHHKDGSFAHHVTRMQLVTASGPQELKPADELFWATAGGLGMTGIITEATIQMRRIPTSYMKVTTERTPDLEETIVRMSSKDEQFQYSVAWIDCLATGSSLGRSVITWADHAEVADLSRKQTGDPFGYSPRTRLTAPDIAPSWLLNRASIKIFNEAWYRKAPVHAETIETIPGYFHPLDGVAEWNRLYGKPGFLQYQFQIPFGTESVLRQIIERLSAARASSFLAVLKRFGPASPGLLSFPAPGWTLALDIPINDPRIASLLDGLDYLVAGASGRVYLAKDSRVAKDLIPVMYPGLNEWAEIAHGADPDYRFISDLGRRLELRKLPEPKASLLGTLATRNRRGPN